MEGAAVCEHPITTRPTFQEQRKRYNSEGEESETAKAAEGTGERRAFSECGFHPNAALN